MSRSPDFHMQNMSPYPDEQRSSYTSTRHEQTDDGKPSIHDVRVISGAEAFNEAWNKEPPRLFSPVTILLYCFCFIGFLCSVMNGYDGSLFNGLLTNNAFKEYFGGSNAGIWAGIVSSLYQIGGVVALPFVGPAVDTWGRRMGMLIGSSIIAMGTIVQGTTFLTHSIGQFMAGRFFLGFGVFIAAAAGPIYVVELCHPAYRGVLTALYNTFWFIGSIIASGAVRGSLTTQKDNVQWLIPVWLQLLCPCIIFATVFFLPESPRWLYVNDKYERSKAVLTKYHGHGNPNSAWVLLQLREYEEFLNLDGADKRWWDYRALFANRASGYRLGCMLIISIAGQWAGNGLVSYFFAAVLTTAGINDEIAQANYNLGYAAFQFLFAIGGSMVVDRIGRRPLLLFTNVACCITWVAVGVSSAKYFEYNSPEASKVVIAFIFIFGAVYSVGFTPLQALYPVEVLSFEMRAKGMAFSALAVNAAGLLNQFAWPVSIDKISWRTYIIFSIWCGIQAVIIFFVIPETKNRTLEELDDIFKAKYPKKESLRKRKVAFDAQHNIVNIME